MNAKYQLLALFGWLVHCSLSGISSLTAIVQELIWSGRVCKESQGTCRSHFVFRQVTQETTCLAMADEEDDDGMGLDEFLDLLDEAQPGEPIRRHGLHQGPQQEGHQPAVGQQGPVRPGPLPGQPRRQGRRPGQGNPPGQGRRRGQGRRPGRQKAVQKSQLKKQRSLDLQSTAFNASGRGRTKDHLFPQHKTGLARPKVRGKGAWKKWTHESIMRCGFSFETATHRQEAAEVDGAGQTHTGQCRFVCALSILQAQEEGMKRLINRSPNWVIKNLMFDESSFDLAESRRMPLVTHSVLLSHAQITAKIGDEVVCHHVLREPQVLLPTMNSATMCEALRAGPGGFASDFHPPAARGLQAVLTTCDAHAANIKLLQHAAFMQGPDELLLPYLCTQHRMGNCLERLTKHLGILGGVQLGSLVQQLAFLFRHCLSSCFKTQNSMASQVLRVKDDVQRKHLSQCQEACPPDLARKGGVTPGNPSCSSSAMGRSKSRCCQNRGTVQRFW